MFSGGADGVADGTGMFRPWKLSRLEPDTSDSHYATSVARVVEYIREGDAFQANIARRFSARIAGDVRTFAHAAITENRAWFGASIDVPTVGGDCDDGSPAGSAGSECLVSMSPELFLRVRPDGTVVTRPIKGTRPSTGGGAQAHASQPARGAITADTISAQGGSSSGRERQPCMPVPSDGPCMPVPSDDPPSDDPRAGGFAVRTVTYHAGCGIVADSDPQAEVEETHAKARAIAQLAGR